MEMIDIQLRFKSKKSTQKMADAYKLVAELVNNMEIESREKTIAMEKLEESFMWAIKGFYGLSEN